MMVAKNKKIVLKKKEPKRATDQEIEDRRERIVELFGEYGEKKLSNADVAKTLGVSVPTIERDIRAIKTDSFKWVESLAKEGYVYECRMTFSRLSNLTRRLNRRILLENDKMSTDDLVKISGQMSKLEELKISILQQPTLYALRLAMKKASKFEDLLVGE